jgi:hypothetical protein
VPKAAICIYRRFIEDVEHIARLGYAGRLDHKDIWADTIMNLLEGLGKIAFQGTAYAPTGYLHHVHILARK